MYLSLKSLKYIAILYDLRRLDKIQGMFSEYVKDLLRIPTSINAFNFAGRHVQISFV